MPRLAHTLPSDPGVQNTLSPFEQGWPLGRGGTPQDHGGATPHVSHTPGLSGAYGTYTQITAGLTKSVFLTDVMIGASTSGNNGAAMAYCMVALGAGTAGNEVVIGVWNKSKINGTTGTGGNVPVNATPLRLPAPIFVPAGTRLAVKAARDSSAGSDSIVIHFRYLEANYAIESGFVTHAVEPLKWASASTTQARGYNTFPNLAGGPTITDNTTFGEVSTGVPDNILIYGAAAGASNLDQGVYFVNLRAGASGAERYLTSTTGYLASNGSTFPDSAFSNFHVPAFVPSGTRIGVDGSGSGSAQNFIITLQGLYTNSIIPVSSL